MTRSSKRMYYSVMDSPCGPLLGIVDEDGAVVRIDFSGGRSSRQMEEDLADEVLHCLRDEERTADLERQLREYFAGQRRSFDLPLAPRGTDFQLEVWSQLREIPFGETISYGTLATSLGRPNASRAVGAANGANPIPILVPCHRVIGADGSLTGFGGGLAAKRTLLELEGVRLEAERQRTLDLG